MRFRTIFATRVPAMTVGWWSSRRVFVGTAVFLVGVPGVAALSTNGAAVKMSGQWCVLAAGMGALVACVMAAKRGRFGDVLTLLTPLATATLLLQIGLAGVGSSGDATGRTIYAGAYDAAVDLAVQRLSAAIPIVALALLVAALVAVMALVRVRPIPRSES